MKFFTQKMALITLGLWCITYSGYTAYPQDGYPDWYERAVLTFTNMCRMDPTGFRDTFVGNYQILRPSSYPAVNPLQWNYELSVCARSHSRDMATNCGLNHSSCNGTSFSARVRGCYSNGSFIGENIAAGYESPLSTVNQWIMDGSPPAADGSGGDGHRANIMNGNFHEMGTGYWKGTQRYTHYWTQDFGGGNSRLSSAVYGGCHDIVADSSYFYCNVFAPDDTPTAVLCNCDGREIPMSTFLGTAERGTWRSALPKASSCRPYFFILTFSSSRQERYPEVGSFITYGEGSCDQDYTPIVQRTQGSVGKTEAGETFRPQVFISRYHAVQNTGAQYYSLQGKLIKNSESFHSTTAVVIQKTRPY